MPMQQLPGQDPSEGAFAAGRRGRRGSLAALLCALALTSCGSSGPSDNGVASKVGTQIFAEAKAAVGKASSVHLVAHNTQGKRVTVSLDMHLSRDGGRGTVSLLGTAFELVRIGDSMYVKGQPYFYKRLENALGVPVKVPPGTWLKGPASQGPLSQTAPLLELQGEVDRVISTTGTLVTGARTTIGGQKAVAVKEKTKVYKGTLYVATTGKPYPLALVKVKGKGAEEAEGGRTTFSEWDKPVKLSPPSPSVDVSSFKK
jgi:hypothetical protein